MKWTFHSVGWRDGKKGMRIQLDISQEEDHEMLHMKSGYQHKLKWESEKEFYKLSDVHLNVSTHHGRFIFT